MGSTCSMNRSKQQKIQSLDQLSYECDEYGVLHPEVPEEETSTKELTDQTTSLPAAHPMSTNVTLTPPKAFEPDENDVSDTFGWVSVKQFHNYFYEGFYAPFILNPDYMFIIDARPEESFRRAHILTSQWHGDVPLQKQELDFRRFSIIVLCDQDGEADENSVVRRIQHFIMRKSGASLEPMIIRGGMELIEKQFPYMLTESNGHRPPITLAFIPWFPAIIIDYCLYMGRTEHAINVKVIKTLSITHVVNLSAKTPGIFPFISYLCVPNFTGSSSLLDDVDRSNSDIAVDQKSQYQTSDGDLRSYFSQINGQIVKALDSGGRVLVHCDEGLDPSAAVVIAFLMMSKSCSLADAHDYVKSLRPIIRPNDKKLSELSEYELELYGRKYTNLDELWV